MELLERIPILSPSENFSADSIPASSEEADNKSPYVAVLVLANTACFSWCIREISLSISEIEFTVINQFQIRGNWLSVLVNLTLIFKFKGTVNFYILIIERL